MKPGLLDHSTGECRPLWRGKLHALSALIAIPAGTALVFLSAHRIVTGIYAVALFATLGTSAAYHCLSRSPFQQTVLRRLDHGMIFVLIAGTWTPLCFVAMSSRVSAVLLSVTWLIAGCGVALSLTWRARKLKNSLYFATGGVAAVALCFAPPERPAALLLAAGCVAFTVGAVLFFSKLPKAWPRTFGFHEFWHTFTVIGAATHFAAVSIVVAA